MRSATPTRVPSQASGDRYRWVALANTTAAMFMATLDGSIVIIALPAIFRGIHLDPLAAGNISYLLWMIMGYRLVQAVLVVTVGRLGDMFGRVRIYNSGFVVFTLASILLSFDPFYGGRGALWLIGWRVVQAGGVALLIVFAVVETRTAEPMFQLSLFRIRAFTAGNLAGLAVSIARGGLQFMLIIWLQGIWLPLHGYDYSQTPLWAGIFLLPLTAGFLASGPVAGILSDKFGSRGIATAGALLFGASFIGLMLLPVDFPFPAFALLIAANGIGSGMFASPNSSSIMGSVPARQRGAASGMRSTFQNSGTAVSIGVFFSVMIAGLASTLPTTLASGLRNHGVAPDVAHQIASLPPVSSLFAAVLGVNPLGHLLAAHGELASLPAAARQSLTRREFFPELISGPFHHGLVVVFAFATVLAGLAALASALRGGRRRTG
jgi:MFS family permease